MDIIAQFFACFSQKLAPARKNSTDWSARLARFCNSGETFVVPTFHIHFLNPECVTIPWVLAPKKFPIENFRVRSDLQKISLFHEFSCRFDNKNRRPAADSILMPPTFHIARLNRYTPNFSGVPQKLTWCQQFGLQIFPK